MSQTGLDAAFLRYIGYDPELQKQHQQFYVPFFSGCRRVVDLGCGYGDFVSLLVGQAIDAVGVDADPQAVDELRRHGLQAVQADAFEYLTSLPDASVDGIAAFHLVEHLPYQKVLELIQQAYRVLTPGGVILLTSPDPRSLYAHLEMFYLHFGHVTFYHPRLLEFFLHYAGFSDMTFASHPSPVQADAPLFGPWQLYSVRVAHLPLWKDGFLHRLLRRVRMAAARLLLNPYLDLIDSNFRQLQGAMQKVDLPFECYVRASKPYAARSRSADSRPAGVEG